ncbi:conserved hypothetical protein [gamma proteobacterium HTCC5015]|nr:conserved hypothetical protein [gamma proteobacterium HTCC5015]
MVNQLSRFTRFAQQLTATLLVLALSLSSAWAQFTVEPERFTTSANSTLQLTLKNEGDSDGSPDLAPLKKDFELMGQNQSSKTECVNFDCTQSTIIRLTVMPKRSGKITIPALNWGKKRSEPVTIAVKKGDVQSAGTRVELLVDESAPYVQSQVILTLRALSNEKFVRGQFTHLSVPDSVIVEAIDSEATMSQTRINGVPHWQMERRFALFPQRSGKLELSPARFQAYFATQQRDMFGRAQYAIKQFASDSHTLDVRPQPSNAAQPWLPAKQLALSHYLSEETLTVGEPVTLSISAVSDGLLAQHLPEIALPEIDGLKTYPDQPVLDDSFSAEGVTAKRVDKIALIPTRAGRFEIPAITVNWWNTQKDKNERVEIGPIALEVAPAASGSEQQPPKTANTPSPQDSKTDQTAPPTQGPEPAAEVASSPRKAAASYWPYIALAFALLWLATLAIAVVFWRKQKRAAAQENSAPEASATGISTTSLRQRLRHGLSATEAAQWITDWGTQLPGQPRGLSAIAQTLEASYPDIAEAIYALHRHLYSGTQQPWDGQTLAEALQSFQEKTFATKANKKPRQRKTLPPLYPDSK